MSRRSVSVELEDVGVGRRVSCDWNKLRRTPPGTGAALRAAGRDAPGRVTGGGRSAICLEEEVYEFSRTYRKY